MADYKVIYRRDYPAGTAPWEAGCPLCLNTVQVARNTATGECYLQLKFANISDAVVESFQANIVVSYQDGTREELSLRPLDADIPAYRFHQAEPVALAGSEIVDVGVSLVETATRTQSWKTQGEPFHSIATVPLALSEAAAQLRVSELADLGKSAADYPDAAQDHGEWWVCSCGMPNVGNGHCARCGIQRKTIFALQDEDTLNLRADRRKEVQDRRRKRKNKILGASVASVALIAVTLGGVFAYVWFKTDIIIPNSRYDEAMELFEAGDYKASYLAFVALGTTKDAEAMKDACGFELGNQYFREGKFEEADRCYPLDSFGEDVGKSKRAIADETREEGRLASAAAMYDAIDEPELAQEARYQYVAENLEGDYNEYLLGFLRQLAKAEYEDAPELLDQYIAKWQAEHPEVAE